MLPIYFSNFDRIHYNSFLPTSYCHCQDIVQHQVLFDPVTSDTYVSQIRAENSSAKSYTRATSITGFSLKRLASLKPTRQSTCLKNEHIQIVPSDFSNLWLHQVKEMATFSDYLAIIFPLVPSFG